VQPVRSPQGDCQSRTALAILEDATCAPDAHAAFPWIDAKGKERNRCKS
jgi:hypothetical protein